MTETPGSNGLEFGMVAMGQRVRHLCRHPADGPVGHCGDDRSLFADTPRGLWKELGRWTARRYFGAPGSVKDWFVFSTRGKGPARRITTGSRVPSFGAGMGPVK